MGGARIIQGVSETPWFKALRSTGSKPVAMALSLEERQKSQKAKSPLFYWGFKWSGRVDLNHRPPGPEDWSHEESVS
jgi:hypothetical protein